MIDAQSDLAALVYDKDQDPDALLRAFADDLRKVDVRAVGLVQSGHHEFGVPRLNAVMLHSGDQIRLFQDLGPGASGCKLDVGQLLAAGTQVAVAIEQGCDLVIINRFGKQESEGKGLAYLIEAALSRDIPVVIAVPAQRVTDWLDFSGAMSVRLPCDREALDAWWRARRRDDVARRAGLCRAVN